MVHSRGIATGSLIDAIVLYALFLSTLASVRANPVAVCTVSDADKSAGIRVFDDPTCVNSGLGCFDEHCRYCKVSETPKSSDYDTCAALGVDFPISEPSTVALVACEITEGDAAVGIAVVADVECVYGGLGCYNEHCRFCKLNETVQSSIFTPCSEFKHTTLVTTPAPTQSSDTSLADITTDASLDVDTEVPAANTTGIDGSASIDGFADTITISADGSGSLLSCTLLAASGDLKVGVDIMTDRTCSLGGVGCIDDICRFCKLTTTAQSEAYPECPDADDERDDGKNNDDSADSDGNEVYVTLSDGEDRATNIETPLEFVIVGCAGAAAAVVMTVLALRRKLREVAISAVRANPVLLIDESEDADNDIASKPSTPSAENKTFTTIETAV